jgi:hypothetical protein
MLRFWRDTQAEQGLHMDKERYQTQTAEKYYATCVVYL